MGMRMQMAATAVLMCGLLSIGGPARATAISDEASLQSFVDFIAMKSAEIELAAEARQKAGAAATAQQLFLLHDIVKRSGEEIKYLKHPALINPLSALEPAQLRTIHDLDGLYEGMDFADAGALPDLLARARARVNAMVDSMPEYTKYPIMYGMLVRDLMEHPESAAADVEIFGHDLIDPVLMKTPTMKILTNPKTNSGAFDVASDRIKANNDDILADLPEGAKETIKFAPSPCQSRDTFLVRATAYYGEAHGIWPMRYTATVESNFDFSALASARVFELAANYEYEHTENIVSEEKYSDRSDYVIAECGQTVSATARFKAPAGARDLTCDVSWTGESGSKASTKSCAVTGDLVEATGSLTGHDPLCSPDKVCGCVVNARGWLRIEGGYKKDHGVVETKSVSIPDKFTAASNQATTIPIALAPDARLHHVGILINRRACPVIYDRLDVRFDSDGSKVLSGNSKGGGFHATFENGKLTVVNATSAGGAQDEGSN